MASGKLEVIKPAPLSANAAQYLREEVFPEIPGGFDITDAGELIQAKYGHLSLTIYIWFTIGRLMCNQTPAPKAEKFKENGDDDDQDFSDGMNLDPVYPDLVLDKFDPILISYAASKEKWYLEITLAALNNLWCKAEWDHSVKLKTEISKTLQSPINNPTTKVNRLDTITEFNITVKIPEFWGYVRFKILDAQQKSHDQKSGCLKYLFKNFEFRATITTKLIDKRFRTKQHKWRAPKIKISYSFGEVNYEILWYPFVGESLPEMEEDTKIPNLSKQKVQSIIDDVFNEKIKQNRDEFIERYTQSILDKLIPRVVEECRSKVDLVLTFATILGNGTDDDIFTLPPGLTKLMKLGAYSVAQRNLRNQILQMLVPTFKMPPEVDEDFENRRKIAEKELEKLLKFAG